VTWLWVGACGGCGHDIEKVGLRGRALEKRFVWFTFLIFMLHLGERKEEVGLQGRALEKAYFNLLFFIYLNSTEMEEMGLQGRALEKRHFGALGLHHQAVD